MNRSVALRSLSILFTLLACAFPPFAQGAGSGEWTNGSRALDDGWRMHEGDRAVFAKSDYDDSAWPTASMGHPGYGDTGWRWYRLHLKLPSSPSPLALSVTGGMGTYELFVNGEKVPGADLRPAWLVVSARPESFVLHETGKGALIALRTFVPAAEFFAHDRSAFKVRLGTQAAIATESQSDLGLRLGRTGPSVAINLLIALAGLAVLALFAAQRDHREYLWLGLYLIASATADGAWTLVQCNFIPLAAICLANSVGYLGLIALVEFTFTFAGHAVNRAWRIYQFLLLLGAANPFFLYHGDMRPAPFNLSEIMLLLPTAILLPVMLFVWYKRGSREAGWLVLPISLSSLTLALYDFSYAALWAGWTTPSLFTDPLQFGPVPLQVWDLANLLFVPAIGVVIILRFTRVNGEQARASAEFGAAREIQRSLVPATLPSVAGFSFDAAYFPAAEVGGDFYQAMERAGESTVIVVGDVSGKGLKAAMTGALAIGALRSLAAQNLNPAALLQGLNQQLASSGTPGFVTCLCVELHQDGRSVFCSAGHLSPYRNGEEMDCGASLPLGITQDVSYSETIIRLEPGDRLTFLTDGVVEARNPKGELFGFDRTLAISAQSAQQIALAAQAFGQEDDITVLTIAFGPVEASAADRGLAASAIAD